MKIGPTLKIIMECNDCEKLKSKYYYECDAEDWGYERYCTHEKIGEKYIGLSAVTPKWCPERIPAMEKFKKENLI